MINWWYSSNPENEIAPIRSTVGIHERGKFADFPDVFDHGEKSLGQTIDQDAIVFVFQKFGLRSRVLNGAYYAGQEKRVHRFMR